MPKVVIIGRPNVGKSSLFNALLGRRRALVHNEPGVTRDRMEESAQWWVQGKSFSICLVDTGGLGGEHFSEEIEYQVNLAISEANLIILVFDAQAGLLPADREIFKKLKKQSVKQPMIGVVNKVDAEVHEGALAEFFELGLENLTTVSAEHRRGIEDLKEIICERLSPSEEVSVNDKCPRIAIVGKPNVGKSTLVNTLLGENRMITSPIAGTTSDAIDSLATIQDKPYILIDTAGIRRKSKTEQGTEVLSVIQTKKALQRCDIAILLLDGKKGITEQDEKLGGLIEEVGCSVILVLNKWDTCHPKFTRKMAAERIRKQLAFLGYAPLIFVSAEKNQGLDRLSELLEEVLLQRKVQIETKEFTEWVREVTENHNPKGARFFFCHQSGKNPPTFTCHVNDPKKVHFSLKRNLINGIRQGWGYMGSPIRLKLISTTSK